MKDALQCLAGTGILEREAAHAIAIQVASFVFMVPLGLGMAATVRVGLAYGAGNRAAIARAGWTSSMSTTSTASASSSLCGATTLNICS